MKKEQLENYWWYRLIKVLFGVLVLTFVAGFLYFSYSNLPPIVLDMEQSKIFCDESEKTVSYNDLQKNKERSSSYLYEDIDFASVRKLDDLEQGEIFAGNIFCQEGDSGIVTPNVFIQQLRDYEEKSLTPHFTVSVAHSYESNIYLYILKSFGLLLLGLLLLELIRRSFYYVILGKSMFSFDLDWRKIKKYITLEKLKMKKEKAKKDQEKEKSQNINQGRDSTNAGSPEFVWKDWFALIFNYLFFMVGLLAVTETVLRYLGLLAQVDNSLGMDIGLTIFSLIVALLFYSPLKRRLGKFKEAKSRRSYNVVWWILVLLPFLPVFVGIISGALAFLSQ